MIDRRPRNRDVLERPVLVLNRLWQAINVCSVRRAIRLLCRGHAHVVHEVGGSFNLYPFEHWREVLIGTDGEDRIHAVSLSIPRPRIIVLSFYDRLPRKEVRFSRANVFSRDKHTCQYCLRRFERRELNLDHVVPRQRGGKTVWTNVVCCCLSCNRIKGNRTPAEAGMRLLREPCKPRWQPFLEMEFAHHYDQTWRHFLDPSGWKVEMGEC